MNRVIHILLVGLLLGLASCNRCRERCVHGQCIQRSCSCDLWYEGDRCDRSSLTSFTGYYRGKASNDTGSYNIGFNLVTTDTPNVLLADSSSIRCSFVTDSRFNVDRQWYLNRWVTGEGEVLVDVVSLRITPEVITEEGSTLIEVVRREKG